MPPPQVRRRILATYVLPLKATAPVSEELGGYLRWLSARMETIVVDDSAEEVFDAHHRAWREHVLHVRPAPEYACANGKVANVLTGLDLASYEAVVIADDDVRYDDAGLIRTVALLDDHDLVRPQNFFSPLPWHAVWDTGRTLLNRAVAADYPGTLGVRRGLLQRTGGYDGNVMFENLELIRTIEAVGGRTTAPLDLYVRRLPPSTGHFLRQRVRQAYDELARPWRMAMELSVVPLALAGARARAWKPLAAGVLGVIATAEAGRRRKGGRTVFPARTAVLAPLWVAERAVCSWLALGNQVARGGVGYAGGILRRAATPRRELRRRLGSGGRDTYTDAAPRPA